MGIAMHTDGVNLGLQTAAAQALDSAFCQNPHDPLEDRPRIVQNGAIRSARNQIEGRTIAAVSIDLDDRAKACAVRSSLSRGSGHNHECKTRIGSPDTTGDRHGQLVIIGTGIAQGAVGLHMGETVPRKLCNGRHGPHLIRDKVFDLARSDTEPGASPETDKIRITWVRPDRHPGGTSLVDRPPHRLGVPGVEAAGNVGRGDNLHHRGIVAHAPWAKAFAEIAVQIDAHTSLHSFNRTVFETNWPAAASQSAGR